MANARNARNVSFSISVRWSIYIINSVDKPNFRVSLPHRRSTTVSSETNPLYDRRVESIRAAGREFEAHPGWIFFFWFSFVFLFFYRKLLSFFWRSPEVVTFKFQIKPHHISLPLAFRIHWLAHRTLDYTRRL